MTFGRASGMSAPASSTPTQLFGPGVTDDYLVRIYTEGHGQVRIGFQQADVQQPGSGFAIPPEGIEFILAAGDELWANGDSVQWPGRLYLLMTKVG